MIASCHAKDVTHSNDFIFHVSECRPGTGALDYRTYLTELSRLPQEPPLMLEHLPNAEEYSLAAGYIRSVAHEHGIAV